MKLLYQLLNEFKTWSAVRKNVAIELEKHDPNKHNGLAFGGTDYYAPRKNFFKLEIQLD